MKIAHKLLINLISDPQLVESQKKFCDSGLNILLSTSFTGQQINQVCTVAIKIEIYVIPFSCHSTMKLIAQI